MVLENASASTQGDSLDDSSPRSDDDPYSNSIPQETSYHIDRSNFPRPIPIIGPLLGYNDQFFSKVLQAKVLNGSKALGRPLTQDEATAFAYWTAKQISIFSYGAPVGISWGSWRCYSTATTMRFPFWQPNLEKFQSDVFPPRLGILKGVRAVTAWHALRFVAYGACGNWFGQLFFGSYSMTVASVGELSDKRLKPFSDAIKSQAEKKRGSLQGIPKPGPMGQQQTGNNQQDDASPSGGMFMEETMGNNDGGNASGTTNQSRPWPAKTAPPQMPTQETPDQPFDAWDDASPAGGQGVPADTSQPRPSRSSGSAWDRLRRGEKPPPPGSRQQSGLRPFSNTQNEAQREQRQGSTLDDSYTFSKSEEERSYAKDEAQKEFDARVERERRGGDFSSGNGDQKRW
jgi:hypothetical protein